MIPPIEFIERVRDIYGKYKEFSGGCFKFHILLRRMYSQARPYYSPVKGHVITQIDDKYYDSTGEVSRNEEYKRVSKEEFSDLLKSLRDIKSEFL